MLTPMCLRFCQHLSRMVNDSTPYLPESDYGQSVLLNPEGLEIESAGNIYPNGAGPW